MTATEPSPKNPALVILRGLIVALAAFELYHFSDGMPLAFEMLEAMDGNWFESLFALAMGIIAPLCAIAAALLAIMNRQLVLACVLLPLAFLIYWMPSIAFAISVMIYGF